MNNKKPARAVKRRVIALLTREEMEFLEKMGMDSLYSAGHKLTKVEIISALVEVAAKLGISAVGVKNKKDLVDRILSTASKTFERREFPRIKKEFLIELRKADSLEEHKKHVTENIGLGGFKIEIPKAQAPLILNHLIEVSIRKSANDVPVKALGRVAWIKEKADPQTVDMGVKLICMKEEDREKMEACLNEEFAKNKNLTTPQEGT